MKNFTLFFFLFPFLSFSQVQIGQDIDGESSKNQIGYAVSISDDGSMIAIGSPYEDGNDNGYPDTNGLDSGNFQIYNYNYEYGFWYQVGWDPFSETNGDLTGASIEVSGDSNKVIVGSPNSDGNGSDSGHVRVYDIFSEYLQNIGNEIIGESAGDGLGSSVSISIDGSVVALGAPYNDGNGSDSGHVRIYENIGGTWTQIGEDIEGEAINDQSGYDVSLSSNGSIVAIGSPYNDDNGENSGHVRIYENIGGTWTQIGNDIEGEQANDNFGISVCLSNDGTIISIGALYNDGNGENSGHMRIYENISGVWTQINEDINGIAEGDQFGTSVYLSGDGNKVIVGAPFSDANGVDSGQVRVYENLLGEWIQFGLEINGQTLQHRSGSSVSMSLNGSIVAIGAPRNTGINGIISGHVRMYENQSGEWIQVGQDIDGEAYEDTSGTSVSLSSDGNIVAIGAPSNDDNGYFAGHVRIYQNQSDNWVQIGQDIDGEIHDNAGKSVSLSPDGNVVAVDFPKAAWLGSNEDFTGYTRIYEYQSDTWVQIGQDIYGEEEINRQSGISLSLSTDGTIVAIGMPNNDDNGNNSGHVRIYEYISDNWVQIGQDINGEAVDDRFGQSVSISGDGSIVAIGEWANIGSVSIYENIGDNWTQIGEDINDEAADDRSGWSISLSNDGNIIAIGAPFNDENGFHSGHTRIFKNQEGVWTQIGMDIDGEAINDRSGDSVSLSSDGNVVAVGAPFNSGNGWGSGHVRIYELSDLLSLEESTFLGVSIFPNPTNNQITVQLLDGQDLEKVNIYNNLGQFIETKNSLQIKTSHLASGLYFVEVITNQGKATKKLIIE